MKSAKSVGRTTGILLLLQLAAGLMLPFILVRSLIPGSPAFLTAGAENAFEIRAGVFIGFVGAALTVCLGLTVYPVFRRVSERAALGFLAVCAISAALDAVQNAAVLSMLSFSQHYAASAAGDKAFYEIAGVAVASARRTAHIAQLFGILAWIFVFYSTLWRFALVPRVLAAVGIVGILLQFTGVTVMMWLGLKVIGEMAMPMLPIQIAVSFWLIFKGFHEKTAGADSEFGLE